jgi:hypothetical protein
MKTHKSLQALRAAFVATVVLLFGANARAQYTGEFVICTDGSSPDNCRATALPADPDTGVITWGRDLGSTLCAGVGFVPQDSDCLFTGESFNGFDCTRVQDVFGARVPAGLDLAIACGDISPLPNGNYSAMAIRSSCFDDVGVCQNFVLTDITPGP